MSDGFVFRPAGRLPEAELYYRLEGPDEAPVVTLLHSLATHGGAWDAEAELLASQGYRVLRIDMRGHGQSKGGGDDFEISSLAEDVLAVWDSLGISKSALVGLSIGGMIAMTLGLERPERLTAIVAADCRSDAPPMFVAMWDERRKLLAEGGLTAIAEATLPTWLTPATLQSNPAMVDRVRAMVLATSTDGYIGATRALQRLAVLDRLPDMTCPIRYIVGAQDGVHPVAMRAMAAATPAADLIEIPDASHMANIEQPQAFASALLPFLAAQLGPIAA